MDLRHFRSEFLPTTLNPSSTYLQFSPLRPFHKTPNLKFQSHKRFSVVSFSQIPKPNSESSILGRNSPGTRRDLRSYAGRSKKYGADGTSGGRIEGAAELRSRWRRSNKARTKKYAESLFYRIKNPHGGGNYPDNFTEDELQQIGLGYDRMVRFMDKDDPNLRHPYDWYKYGHYGPYSWRGVVVGDPVRRPSTSYRKKKVEKDEDVVDTELYRDPTSSLYYTNQVGIDNAVPVLLVDGYNVCGYWMKLKKHFMKGRLDIARQKLIDELVTFSMLREVKVVVVFDAMMSGFPTHKEDFAGLDIIFSGETCADTWIEKEVAALKEDGCPKVWVVTSDHCHQQAAHGAGAFIWSCKALVTEIKASQKEVEKMLQEQRSTSFQGRLLKHNLDAEVVDALKDLRKQLSENELK